MATNLIVIRPSVSTITVRTGGAASGGGGGSDHTALGNLAWTASGHTGTSGAGVHLGGFDASGVATEYTAGTGLSFSGSSIVVTAIDNSSFTVLMSTTLQSLFDETDAELLKARSTGVQYGGVLTDQGSGVVRISAGVGGILDNTDPMAPVYTPVSWSQTDLDLHATNGLHYVYVDETGTVTSTTTAPTHEDYRTAIWLHRVSILSSAYSASTPIPMPVQQYGAGMWDIWRALGSIKRGLNLSAASTNLTIAVSSGEAFQAGANFYAEPRSPHRVVFALKSPATFKHALQDGTLGSAVTALDVGNYDVGGVLTPIPGSSTRATIFTVLMFLGNGGNVRILYGQAWYASVTAAQDALRQGTYQPTIPASFADAITLGWVIAQKGATNLADGTQVFVTANKFGLTGGAVASTGTGALLTVNALSELSGVASTARANIGLVIGTDVMAYSAASAASKLFGRGDSGAGSWQEIALGTGLSMSGTTLSASVGTTDHAALLSNLAWSTSGHTGTASRIAGFSGAGAATYYAIGTDLQAWDTDLDALAGLSSTGLVVRSGSGSATVRSIAGTSPVQVSNGSGVSGNPTISVDAASTSASGIVTLASDGEESAEAVQGTDFRLYALSLSLLGW